MWVVKLFAHVCRDRLDAGRFRPVEDTILFLTWHEAGGVGQAL